MAKRKQKYESMDLFDEDMVAVKVSPQSKKADELESLIEILDTLYEEGKPCINPNTNEVVSDNEYDILKAQLQSIRPNSYIFKSVTSSKYNQTGKKIVHHPPMTSINKCNAPTQDEKEEILAKFIEDVQDVYNDDMWDGHWSVDTCVLNGKKVSYRKGSLSMSYKRDGIAVSLEYERGELVRAGLRSKSGKDGIDVTEKMEFVDGVVTKLCKPINVIIRGELETTKEQFEKVNSTLPEKEQFANPRGFTAGSMNLKGTFEFQDRGVRFVAHRVIMDNPPFKTEVEMAKFASNLGFHYVYTHEFNFDKLKELEENHRNLAYLVDGVVISASDLAIQECMGTVGDKDTGNPKGRIAWKFADEKKRIKVKNIIWQTGRTGNITPVLIFDGVQIEGTTVSKCTAHNLGYMYQNNIEIGAAVEIIKSGKIIPKVHKVIDSPNWTGSVSIPQHCPSCLGTTFVEDGDSEDTSRLICKNSSCPAQNIKKLDHFLAVLGVKGISESTITKLVDATLVQTYADFYKLTVDGLVAAGFTERTAILIVARIWMIPEPEQNKDNNALRREIKQAMLKNKINMPVNKFFAAFGISNAGKEVGRLLMKNFRSWSDIKKVSETELLTIDGVGPTIAKEIPLFFKKDIEIVEDVEKYFDLIFPTSTGKLAGKIFVLSGSIDGGKDYWKEQIEDAGGIVTGSVSKKTHYLIAGPGSGLKSDKARELNIPILTVDELEQII